jgi:hypothetical protein
MKGDKFLSHPDLKTLGNSIFEALLVLCGAAATSVIIGSITAAVVHPQWVAAGWSSFNHYPKNIELRSLMLILLLVPVFSVALEIMKAKWIKVSFVAVLTSIAGVQIYERLALDQPSLWVLHLGTIAGVVTIFYHSLTRPAEENSRPPSLPGIYWVVGACLIWIAYFLLFILQYKAFAGQIDFNHNGENFMSALDLVRGGTPFVTFFWPHGLVDTGVIAIAFKASSRMDVPTMWLGYFAMRSLAIPALFLCAYGLRLGHFSLVIAFIVLCFNPALLDFLPYFIFVFLSFLLFTEAKKKYHFFLSGAAMFAAHVYRIDTGIYGFAAVLLVSLYLIVGAYFNSPVLLKEKVISLLFFLGGVFCAAALAYAVCGWPGRDWYEIAFSLLPKYHADSTGLPFPLPLRDTINYRFHGIEKSVFAVSYVVAVIGILAAACIYLYRNVRKVRAIDVFPLLLIVLAVLNIRSAFSRSDLQHITWAASIAYVTVGLLIARAIAYASFTQRGLKIVLVIVFFAFFNFSAGLFNNNPLAFARKIMNEGSTNFLEEYRTIPEQCANGLFSLTQLTANPYLDRSVCITQEILRAQGIGKGKLLISHSASLLYPMLGYELPTKYYSLGWAITEDMQRDLVAELEKADISAVLMAEGYAALTRYDIPDSVRIPVYHEWLMQRFDLSKPVFTPLGKLVLRK